MRSQPAEKEGWKGVLLFQLGVNARLWDIMKYAHVFMRSGICIYLSGSLLHERVLGL